MAFRDDVTAYAARADVLAAEVADKTRELDAVRADLEQLRARAKLPVLDQIRVAAPCREDWNAMTGDDRVRHCGACDKRVFDLSSMTRDEAEALIVEREGRLCVRYFQRHDGTILTSDCTIGITRRRRRRIVGAGIALLASAAGAAAYHHHIVAEGRYTLGSVGTDEPVDP